ncbi:MAG: gamma carbonic anhydrase family protein [Candidatus Izimaplasma sp.]|nr:gamma carbonic anhydrase family protein [Candidatus Izimaplasma bacterium]
MYLQRHLDQTPRVNKDAKIFQGANLSGDIVIDEGVNIWYNVSMRGDMAPIRVGKDTNIQDNAVIHTNTDLPTDIGKNVTIGHGAIIHACTIEDDALIGMGSIILDGAVVEQGALVGAGTLVPPGKTVPSYHLALGNPMKVIRKLTEDEIKANKKNNGYYLKLVKEYE